MTQATLNTHKIYVFSGLGVDERAFGKIDFTGLNVEFIDWIDPLKKESLESYAHRIAQKITEENFMLMGLSFGGILAVEISKFLKPQKTILIASAKTKNELPAIYKILGKLGVTKIVPYTFLKLQNFISNWLFGLDTPSEKKLLKDILKDTKPKFLRWAINEIVNWNNEQYPENYIHIHGNKDRIIPIKNVKTDYIIENGGHFMTVTNAKEIEKIIKKCLRAFQVPQ